MNTFLTQLEKKLTQIEADLSNLSVKEQFELIRSKAADIIKPDLLKEKLERSRKTNQPLKIKYGIDPTGKDIHLGHIAPVIMLSRLQRLGHKIQLIFGDFTAQVGDPSGRVKSRSVLSEQEIKSNVATYKEQFAKFLDLNKTEIYYNSSFVKELTVLDLFKLYSRNRLSPLLQREDFRNRLEGLSIAETLYPTLMAIDSLALKTDVEVGGRDQFLNFQTVVEFMERDGLETEAAVTTDLLLSLSGSGKKMSKSEGNYIALTASPSEVFGKIMSMPDNLMEHFFKVLTEITDQDWLELIKLMDQDLNPMEVKKLLARIITAKLHSAESARQAESQFIKVFSKDELPKDLPTINLTPEIKNLIDLLVTAGLAASKSQASRLIKAGAVSVYGREKLIDTDSLPPVGSVLKVGKRKWLKIK